MDWNQAHGFPATNNDPLSRRAWQTTTKTGTFFSNQIEGSWPNQISGKWTKIGPGKKENFAVPLNHFFDGDAYFTEALFDHQGVTLKTGFLETDFFLMEQKLSRMSFHEFGTAAPGWGKKKRKNQPNINIIPWNNQLMALSEGGHPALLNDSTFKFLKWNNFNQTLSSHVSFGAHPKLDPIHGSGYGFGFNQGLSRSIKLFEMDSTSNRLREVMDLPQNHVPMIHDMIETESYIILIVSSAHFKFLDLILGREPLAESLFFDVNLSGNAIIFNKTKTKNPVQISLPPLLCFHHGGAIEEPDGKISIFTFKTNDGSLLESLSQWQSYTPKDISLPHLSRIQIDLNQKVFLSDTKIISAHDFPVSRNYRHFADTGILYASRMGRHHDPLAFDGFSRINVKTGAVESVEFKPDETAGEVVLIPNKENSSGWIGLLGYNQTRNKSFVELRSEESLEFLARAWFDHAVPLGFHGHFRD